MYTYTRIHTEVDEPYKVVVRSYKRARKVQKRRVGKNEVTELRQDIRVVAEHVESLQVEVRSLDEDFRDDTYLLVPFGLRQMLPRRHLLLVPHGLSQ